MFILAYRLKRANVISKGPHSQGGAGRRYYKNIQKKFLEKSGWIDSKYIVPPIVEFHLPYTLILH